jgi:hypothetical protein
MNVRNPHAMFPRRVLIPLLTALGVLLVLVTTAAVLALRFRPLARDYIVSALRERYGSEVELGDLSVSFFPSVHAVGENLVLRFRGRRDVPPMIRARRFTLDADFVGFFRNPKRIALLRLDGLEIRTPPKAAPGANPVFNYGPGEPAGEPAPRFVLEEVVADSSMVVTTPADPAKAPLIFRIRQLKMHSVGIGRPMTFQAKVENPEPPGLIDSEGNIGPWNVSQPGDTPLSGRYSFRDADLGVFKGISGILSSDGRFQGQLGQIEVHGTADVPEFALDTADRPMRLSTEFDATVDGANGNTVLHPVHARLGNSSFEVSGSIARGASEQHKEILLDTQCAGGRLEDFLRLAMKGPGIPMTGRIAFAAKVKIPPGLVSIADRIELEGTFSLNGVRFSSPDVQGRISGLSHRAQGDPNNRDPNVTAEFSGLFHLRNGQLGLPRFAFELPGAHLTMAGSYGLRSGAIDLDGAIRLDAKVSQMTTGFKSVLLRPLDRFFERDGAGTVLPIHISGTRGQPEFALDIGRILRRR